MSGLQDRLAWKTGDVEIFTPDQLERERRASILEAAALEIEVNGWCQGRGIDDSDDEEDGPNDGRRCLLGGIYNALSSGSGNAYADAAAVWYGREATSDDWTALWTWNDVGSEYGPCEFDNEPLRPPPGTDIRTADEVTFILRWRAQEIRDGG